MDITRDNVLSRLMVVLEASVYPKGVLLLCARAGSAIPVRGSVISLF